MDRTRQTARIGVLAGVAVAVMAALAAACTSCGRASPIEVAAAPAAAPVTSGSPPLTVTHPAAPVVPAAAGAAAAGGRMVSDGGGFAVARVPIGFRPQGTPLIHTSIAGALMITQDFTSAADPSQVRYAGPRFSITATVAPPGADLQAHVADMRSSFRAVDGPGLPGGRHPIVYDQVGGQHVLEWVESPSVTVTVSGLGGTTAQQLTDAANGMEAR